jgi:hypothetical protein
MRLILRALMVMGILLFATVVGVAVTPKVARAGLADGGAGSGTISVGVGDGGATPGSPGGGTGSTGGKGGTGTGGAPVRNPWTCTYLKLVLNDIGGFAPGGPTPGSWYSVTCNNSTTGASWTQTEWIADQAPTSAPPVDPHALALEALKSLRLPAPTAHFDPAVTSVVNLPTWLWIDNDIWHPQSVTATAGAVSATAVATPVSVTWSMGDGGVVTCAGPGLPFVATEAQGGPGSACTYTYSESSAGQPSPDGNPDDGAFNVQATVAWSVSWSARGAVGGGSLPGLFSSTPYRLRVEQIESINSEDSAIFGIGRITRSISS